MADQRITAEELLAELQEDLKALAEKMAAAMNAAQAGHIIAEGSAAGKYRRPKHIG